MQLSNNKRFDINEAELIREIILNFEGKSSF
jgi:hypothetical protein